MTCNSSTADHGTAFGAFDAKSYRVVTVSTGVTLARGAALRSGATATCAVQGPANARCAVELVRCMMWTPRHFTCVAQLLRRTLADLQKLLGLVFPHAYRLYIVY